MDWGDIGKIVAPLAPTLGSVLGGLIPIPGGSMLGETAGKVLADALGVPNDPVSVGKAIQDDPLASQKIQAAEQEAIAKWGALAEMEKARAASDTAQQAEMQTTIRAELVKGQPPYAWRNMYGYSITFEVAGIMCLFFYSILFSPEVFNRLMSASTWLTGWFTLRFTLVGYIHSQATAEKVAAATGQPAPTLVSSIVKAVKGK